MAMQQCRQILLVECKGLYCGTYMTYQQKSIDSVKLQSQQITKRQIFKPRKPHIANPPKRQTRKAD